MKKNSINKKAVSSNDPSIVAEVKEFYYYAKKTFDDDNNLNEFPNIAIYGEKGVGKTHFIKNDLESNKIEFGNYRTVHLSALEITSNLSMHNNNLNKELFNNISFKLNNKMTFFDKTFSLNNSIIFSSIFIGFSSVFWSVYSFLESKINYLFWIFLSISIILLILFMCYFIFYVRFKIKTESNFGRELNKLAKREKLLIFIDDINRLNKENAEEFIIKTSAIETNFLNDDKQNFIFIYVVGDKQFDSEFRTKYFKNELEIKCSESRVKQLPELQEYNICDEEINFMLSIDNLRKIKKYINILKSRDDYKENIEFYDENSINIINKINFLKNEYQEFQILYDCFSNNRPPTDNILNDAFEILKIKNITYDWFEKAYNILKKDWYYENNISKLLIKETKKIINIKNISTWEYLLSPKKFSKDFVDENNEIINILKLVNKKNKIEKIKEKTIFDFIFDFDVKKMIKNLNYKEQKYYIFSIIANMINLFINLNVENKTINKYINQDISKINGEDILNSSILIEYLTFIMLNYSENKVNTIRENLNPEILKVIYKNYGQYWDNTSKMSFFKEKIKEIMLKEKNDDNFYYKFLLILWLQQKGNVFILELIIDENINFNKDMYYFFIKNMFKKNELDNWIIESLKEQAKFIDPNIKNNFLDKNKNINYKKIITLLKKEFNYEF